MAKRKEKTAAVITIFKPNRMSARGRREIASWLAVQGVRLMQDGKKYADRFTARYLYL